MLKRHFRFRYLVFYDRGINENAYIKILTYYKGLQSGQIAPLAGLFGRGSGVIWPICYFEVRSLCKLPRQQ